MRTLQELYKQDQADRRNQRLLQHFDQITARDAVRRKEMALLLSAKQKLTADECYAVAMLYQHGPALSHSRLAVRFAKRAVDAGHKKAKWLYAAATDRLLSKQGKPQKYGTQFIKKNNKSPWKLHPVDPRVTDEERAQYNVPTLSDAKKRAVEMNKK